MGYEVPFWLLCVGRMDQKWAKLEARRLVRNLLQARDDGSLLTCVKGRSEDGKRNGFKRYEDMKLRGTLILI